MSLKIRDGKKEGIRYQVSGRCLGVGSEKTAFQAGMCAEKERSEVRGPKSEVERHLWRVRRF